MVDSRQIDPIARFMLDHDRALVQLASLNKAARSIGEHGYSPESFRRIRAALEYIDEEVTIHNRTEEEALFPVLERYVEGPTALMKEDHKILKKEFSRLKRAVGSMERHKRSKKAGHDLATVSQTIVQVFVNHIHKENYILFPLVRKFLTKDALREVARRMV